MNVQEAHTVPNLLRCFLRFHDRADRLSSHQLVDTFVSAGPLTDVLENPNNQIIYGRRGTGKTHALKYLQRKKEQDGDICLYIDCRNIGSEQSIYENQDLPITERATRLLIDVIIEIHTQLYDAFTNPKGYWDLSELGPRLDTLYDVISMVRVRGNVEQETRRSERVGGTDAFSADASISPTAPSLGVSVATGTSSDAEASRTTRKAGVQRTWVEFGSLGRAFREICEKTSEKRIWILIDEWSAIPNDIQPFLADLIRRTMFTVPILSIKIAAIEHRSNFKIDLNEGQYIGFELGADITSNLNLDDYLVFENDSSRAEVFFKNLIARHIISISKELGIEVENEPSEIVRLTFTQHNVFTEFVQASEGVPRDAMHILSICAQRSPEEPISMPTLRNAAYAFFNTEKYGAIQANDSNRAMLDWIRDKVIQGRQTRAFLVPVAVQNAIINRLFDQRALHIRKKSMSSAHRPGERFVVYKIDYGCYVDLINTQYAPNGMLLPDDPRLEVDFEVPDDDARSYRRAVLELDEFYQNYPEFNTTDNK